MRILLFCTSLLIFSVVLRAGGVEPAHFSYIYGSGIATVRFEVLELGLEFQTTILKIEGFLQTEHQVA